MPLNKTSVITAAPRTFQPGRCYPKFYATPSQWREVENPLGFQPDRSSEEGGKFSPSRENSQDEGADAESWCPPDTWGRQKLPPGVRAGPDQGKDHVANDPRQAPTHQPGLTHRGLGTDHLSEERRQETGKGAKRGCAGGRRPEESGSAALPTGTKTARHGDGPPGPGERTATIRGWGESPDAWGTFLHRTSIRGREPPAQPHGRAHLQVKSLAPSLPLHHRPAGRSSTGHSSLAGRGCPHV